MATRNTSRSQRAPAALQTRSQAPRGTQPGPSQSQRPRTRSGRTQEEHDEDADEGDGDGPDDNDDSDTGNDADALENGGRGGGIDIQRKASELVRLALFSEHRRIPLKRDDINKKVLGSNSRAFADVFDYAQNLLQKTFGMELAELPSRAGLETGGNVEEEEVARRATGIKRKAQAASSKTYILRSVLHPLVIEHAAQTDEQILEAETIDMLGGDSDDEEDYEPQCYGSIISWSHSDYLGPLGILHTILALILVNGRTLTDVEMRTQLKRLGLQPNTHVPFPAHSTTRSAPIEQYLTTLIRQGYLDRYQVDSSGAASKKGGTGVKRGRVSLGGNADEGDGGPTYEWRWGVRAQSEIGEHAVAKWVAEFMVGNVGIEDDEEEEEEEQRQSNGRKKSKNSGKGRKDGVEQKLEKMMKGIEKAAGGALAPVR